MYFSSYQICNKCFHLKTKEEKNNSLATIVILELIILRHETQIAQNLED